MTHEATTLTELLCEALRSRDSDVVGDVRLDGDRLSVLDGALAISVEVRRDEGDHPNLAHAHVIVETDRPDIDRIETCAIGIGAERNAALADLASNWVTLAAPPILSLLHDRPVLGANRFRGEEVWGVLGRHGFVGPVGGREVRGAMKLEDIAQAPLFILADELTADGNVHLVKVTLQGVEGGPWQRTLETDGHAASHTDDDWSFGPALAGSALCTRFAIFYRVSDSASDEPARARRMTLDDAIERFVAAYASDPHAEPNLGFRVLMEQGVEEKLAAKIDFFVPLAFGRLVLGGFDIRFFETYVRVSKDGTFREGYRLAEEPVYRHAVDLAPSFAGSSQLGEGFKRVSMLSSELEAVNDILHKGVEPNGLVLSPPAIIASGISPEAMNHVMERLGARADEAIDRSAKAKRWWEFWK